MTLPATTLAAPQSIPTFVDGVAISGGIRMSNRRNRIWSGATRSVVLVFLVLGTLVAFSASADAYMPPPVKAPEVVPGELPGEYYSRQDTGRTVDSIILQDDEEESTMETKDSARTSWLSRLLTVISAWVDAG